MASSSRAKRIQVMGSSGSGKSTVGLRLAEALGVPHVELDALFWQPSWVESEAEDFRTRVAAATEGERWVVSGNYTGRLNALLWQRAEMVIWLDLPQRITVSRMLIRSWRRWRTNELLWGTNRERFWPQLAFWDPTSLLGYSLSAHPRMRQLMTDAMADPRWVHVRFVRLTSQREVDRFVASMITERSEDSP